jgi:hypothetical protein
VIWPKDWIVQVLPPTTIDKWYYIIHERLEPAPQDDLEDPMYTGGAVLVLASVPKECEPVDIRTWLLFGIAQDYEPLERVHESIRVAEKKRDVLKQKLRALPSIEVDGSPEQQAEMRKKLSDAITSHSAKFNEELDALSKKRVRIEKLLMTEPMELTAMPIDKPVVAANDKQESMEQYAKRIETRSWTVRFTSPRGEELASVALAKRDWNYVCLVQTRPVPKAFIEDDQVQNQIISDKDLVKEVNMRLVRLKRLRHGIGERLQLTAEASEDGEKDDMLKPWEDGFHISSIGAMYCGEWKMGEKHGKGKEFTNVGIYDGEFERNYRQGRGKLVYGNGTTVSGTFDRRTRAYAYSKKYRDQWYAPSLLCGDQFRDGVEHGEHMQVAFPDGATYEGEMTDGKVTGYGIYTSSTGVVDEGYFVDGVLHGDNCSRRYPDGTTQRGRFESGQLHGRGELCERNGDVYDGDFEYGTKTGRGTSYFDQRRCKHVGFWFENTMTGRGECFIKNETNPEPISTREVDGEHQDDWDFWYEGSFVRGQTQARHRFVDLKKRHNDHLPFTTNGKSDDKIPYLTHTLPSRLAKLEARRQQNAVRRSIREKQYLEKQGVANLTLYYGLLDEFYEHWVQTQRERKEDESLEEDAEAREELRQQRAAAIEYAKNRVAFRKEKYELSPRKRDLAQFESYLERVTLSERVRLDRAAACETTAVVADMEKTAAEGK